MSANIAKLRLALCIPGQKKATAGTVGRICTAELGQNMPPMPSMRQLMVCALLFIAVWFAALGFRDLIKTDEGRYAEIAREMVATNDWLTPRLNGLQYFEKPPLQYWATGYAFELFGMHDWVARLWPGLTGLVAIIATMLGTMRLYGKQAGLVAGAILASSLSFFLMSHFNALDMGFTCMLTLALWTLVAAHTAARNSIYRARWMLCCWAAMGLAVLSKGLAGIVLPGAVLMLYMLTQRDWAMWTKANWTKGLLIFLLITSPWFILMAQQHPRFAEFFFIHEHFERFTSDTHRRFEPFWYFVPQLLLGLLPWTVLLPQALKLGAQGAPIAYEDRPACVNLRFCPNRLLLIWSVCIFLFFSASNSKLPSYIVPIFPAIAALMAGAWVRGTPSLRKTVLLSAGAVGALLIVGSIWLAIRPQTNPIHLPYAPWLTSAGVLLLVGSVAALLIAKPSRPIHQGLTIAAFALLANATIVWGHNTFGRHVSAKTMVEQLKPYISNNQPVFSVKSHEQTLPFYLNRTVVLVDYRDEFDFGLQVEPHKGVASLEEFKQRWQQHSQAWAYMTPAIYMELEKQKIKMKKRFENEFHVMVSKQ